MAEFKFITKSGGSSTIQADTPEQALANAVDIDPHSGVQNLSAIKTQDLIPEREIIPQPTQPAVEAAGLDGAMQQQQDTFAQSVERDADEKESQFKGISEKMLQEILGFEGETTLTAKEESKKGGVDDIQKELDDINQQINVERTSLLRQREAVEKEAGLTGGQKNARISEINRVSLRKQADLSIIQQGIQGRFDSAKAIADRAVAVQMEQQKTRLAAIEFVYNDYKDLFTRAEQREFDLKLSDRNRAIEKEENDLQNKYNLALQLQRDGAPSSVVDRILKSSSFDEAIIAASSYSPAGEGGAPKIFKINGEDMVWDSVNQKFVPAPTTGGTGGQSPYSAERAARTVQSVDELLVDANSNPGIFGRTAALPLPTFARSEAFRNFSTELDTLKANIAFNELTAMREASKTGGALGQVSDREGKLLESALGGLSMSQSPQNFVEQLHKIKASINRWNNAVNGTNVEYTITAPNGEEIIIID